MEAEDSVLFATAKALVTGNVTLSDLQPTSEGLFEPEAIRVANMIEYEVDESLGKSGTVEVALRSGEKLSGRVDIAPGHRDHPLTKEQREQKFAACAALAGSRISDARVREVVDLVDALDEVPDVRVLAGLLSGA